MANRNSGFYQYTPNDPSPFPHGRKDSTTSSFFGAPGAATGYQRPSTELLNHQQNPQTPGYSGDSSYYGSKPTLAGSGDVEKGADGGWDVYADFNNVGPRYSSLKTGGNQGYQPIAPPPIRGSESVTTNGGPVELVTVPKLGAEWKADELRAMTKQGRQEEKTERRRDHFRAWNRDQRGCCGTSITRKLAVWIIFGVLIVVGLLLFFTIPRPPQFVFQQNAPLTNSTDSEAPEPEFARFPANFTFFSSFDLEINTNANWLPLKFNNVHLEVFDIETSRKIAEGDSGPMSFPAKKYTRTWLPVVFNYTAANDTDRTWADVYNSCRNGNNYPDGVRPGMNLRVQYLMSIAGLINKPQASTTLGNVPCPFELPSNAA